VYSNYEIIVVDNGSKDGTIEILQKWKVRIIQSKTNLGYGGGINMGVSFARGKYIVVSNPDITFGKKTLALLNDFRLNENCVGAIPIMMKNVKNEIINAYGVNTHPTGISWSNHFGKEILKLDPCVQNEPFAPSGACFIIRRNDFLKIGGFFSPYFLYMEEVELMWRARILGFKVVILHNLRVYHKYQKHSRFENSELKIRLLDRNRLHMILTKYDKSTLLRITPVLLLLELAMVLTFFLKGMISSKIWVYSQLLRNRASIFRNRKLMNNIRVIPDSQILKSMSIYEHPLYMGNSSLFGLFFKFSGFIFRKSILRK
ncbi:MAG: glycosyltransferase, partial [Candidatus Heimdallarchaeota archaeon]|nr:glycosyltransferase [Candidatus Heimdallarchaeota archaeon]